MSGLSTTAPGSLAGGPGRRTGRLVVDGATATAALSNPACVASLPSNAVRLDDASPLHRFIFGGTDAADEVVNYQVIAWSKFVGDDGSAPVLVPRLAAKGSFTLGSQTYGSGGANLGASGNLFADTITEDLGSPAVVNVHSPADNTMAWLDLDLSDAFAYEVETDVDTAASADVFCQPVTPAWIMSALKAALASPSLSGYTTEVVKIDAAAGAQTAIKAAVSGKVIACHALLGRAGTDAGSIKIESNNTALTGTMPMGIYSPNPVPMEKDRDFCLKTSAGEALNMTTVACTFDGWAVVSY